ncbi:DUF1796 family putative cysteine peptidase [Fulvivirga ligni]|uniref:DUF1796 family putative cysteine peptidase n=1 Tax=Fulvivirga ligni TaxID=2904246 RepID=UPI001F46B758|nr:DUF1796 family putative cysteine peptidase [Fulvivirga ligni]UII23880.1 papain-like cysteine peptidase [Fulvivirga ligni]
MNSEIILDAVEISNTINHWLSDSSYVKVSMGENCNSSWYLKETGNKEASYPYDWIFSSGDIISHTIRDEFKSFLNKDMMFNVNRNKAGHSLYHSLLFNHRNPLKSNEDYQYYVRASDRFLKLLKNNGNNILFVCTVIQETNKRPGWTKGFDRSFKVPINQNLDSFTEMIQYIKSINENVKFIFINQLTEDNYKLEIKSINSVSLWLDFCSEGENSGVKYLNRLDDTIMKIIYKGMCQKASYNN